MKRYIRLFLILLLIIISVGGINLSYANNDKKIILSEKYNQKKVDKIKSTVKQKNNYRFLIKSDDFLDEINTYFEDIDKKIKVKDYKNGNYMIKIPHNSDLLAAYVNDIDSGILPTTIGGYDIIQPEIVEGMTSPQPSPTGEGVEQYLSGELVDNMWGMSYLGADLFQEELSSKSKKKIAILDTGIDYTHTDLDDNYNTTLSYDFVNEDSDAMDDNGHGTQVAGIIGAEVNTTGIYGVNSNSDLVALKVLDVDGLGTSYDILEAIDYAKVNGIKVINMSFGGVGSVENNPICDAITDAKANGIYTITSAGNNNTSIDNIIPASCPDVITVGAIDELAEKASFSNYGTGVSLYAPGVDIYTTGLNGGYGNVSGTSHSAAFVSGLVSKELAFSGGISYDDLVGNLKYNYNLIDSYTAETDEETNQTVTGTGWVNTEDLYFRFVDFKYLSNNLNYIYYADELNKEFIYKLNIDQDNILALESYYINNPRIVFSNRINFIPEYYNSGVFISIEQYGIEQNIDVSSDNIVFENDAYKFSSIGKNYIDYKFDQISGQKLLELPGYIYGEDDNYLYYQNKNDNYTLYRIKKDGTESIGTKIINVKYAYPYIIDDIYIYYQNRNDNYTLYKIKKDGTEVSTGGIKIIDIRYSYPVLDNLEYIYYRNNNDNYTLYRIKKDGTESIGTKIINSQYAYPTFYNDGYIYYQNSSDEYKLYKIKDDGSEVLTSGIKISDNTRFQYIGDDTNYIYYLDRDIVGGIYKIKNDGTESTGFGTKIMNAPENGFFMMGNMFIDEDYIFFTDMENQDMIYRIKKDGTELSVGPTQIVSSKYNQIIFLEGDYIYYTSREFGGGIYRARKDGSGEITKINDLNSNFKSYDLDYIYYLSYNSTTRLYSYYKVKKDGTDTIISIEKEPYRSQGIILDEGVVEIKIKVDSIVPEGTDYKFYLSDDNSNFVELDKTLLNGIDKIYLNNIFGLLFNKTIYYKIELLGDITDPSKTPVINYVDVSLGNTEINYISDIVVTGGNGCDSRRRQKVYLDLYKTNFNGEKEKFYSASKSYEYNSIGCGSWGWLWGSRSTRHTCELVDITSSGINSSINYKCTIKESRSGSAAGGPGYTRYTYRYGSFIIDNDLCSYDEKYCNNIPEPTNLKQYVHSPGLERVEFGSGVEEGSEIGIKIGKYQSGTGLIFTADVDNTTDGPLGLIIDIYDIYNFTTPKISKYGSGFIEAGNTGTLEALIPFDILGEGDYYWKAKLVNNSGRESEEVDFGSISALDTDFSFFEGFEPYPYGYSFYNRKVEPGFLTGGIDKIFYYNYPDGNLDFNRQIILGGKWKIFDKTFDLSVFENDIEKMDAFESMGLDKENVFNHGSCYGMAVSSALQYTESGALFIKNNYQNFSLTIGTGTIRKNINSPSSTSTGDWDIYNETLETILSIHLSQNSKVVKNSYLSGITDLDSILTELDNFSDNIYTLSLKGTKINGDSFGHRVIPYKVEGNKIYIWDNNFPYPYRTLKLSSTEYIDKYANEQYIEIYIDDDGKTKWKTSYNYGINKYGNLTLIDIDLLYNKSNKFIPKGFGDADTLYTLSGSSNIYLIDDEGRISGFINGYILEEIPGVYLENQENFIIDGEDIDNTWKQIYLPKKIDGLTINISGNIEESYDFMIAGGDYYTKIENVETSSGQIDTFNISRENIQIDFDDNKIGNYNLLIDNFQESGIGTVYIDNVISNVGIQQYLIDWTGVENNTNDAVIYGADTNNDGSYDKTINLQPIFQDNISSNTSYSFSGELTEGYLTGSFVETVEISLTSIDNEGGSGVDKIFYAIGTDTGVLEYLSYSGTLIVNGLGDYTLNYYSVDNFGNIEDIKTVNFSLTEKPETYSGIISGFVYDDSNENGIHDDGEKYMAGWKICIDENNDNDCQENFEQFIVTNNDGYYEFNGLITGIYKVIEIPHQNWLITIPIDKFYNINLGNGDVVSDKNFGNYKNKVK